MGEPAKEAKRPKAEEADSDSAERNRGAEESDEEEEEEEQKEEKDAEGDGFHTASEGNGSDEGEDDFEDHDEEGWREAGAAREGIASLGLVADEGGEEKRNLKGEEVGEGGKGEPEKKLVLSEEEEKIERQRRIDQANEAKAEGNSLYAEGKYFAALSAYDKGLTAWPLPEDSAAEESVAEEISEAEKEIRAVLHCNKAACHVALQHSTETVKECTAALELRPNYVKALMRRSQALEQTEEYEDALGDVKKVLEIDARNSNAQAALRRMTPLAEAKRERMKTEMIGKLKEAGNSLLGHFGMSIDNFKTVQDPNTGSYSIQFQR